MIDHLTHAYGAAIDRPLKLSCIAVAIPVPTRHIDDHGNHHGGDTWKELREDVRSLSNAMRSFGVAAGDVVCIIGGISPWSLAIFLAIASVGAIVSALATDAGKRVLLDRMGQVNPKLVFAEPSYQHNGKRQKISIESPRCSP
jgi:acyl-coenzyme A synthetase/AMP-(fatty) acid ligase